MKERTIRCKGRRVRRRAQHRWYIGGGLLALSLPIALVGVSKGEAPKAVSLIAAVTDNPPAIAMDYGSTADNPPATVMDYGATEEQQSTDVADTDGDWYLTLVNRWNPIPENYEVNLVEAPGGEMVDERIYESLMEMLEAAKEGNWGQLPLVVSGYRTKEKQQRLYDDRIAQYRGQGYSESDAKEMAEQWVAVPGYSEHQLGFAVDINGATYDVYLWLQENSYKYGFIFRYPGNKTEITGTAEEAWHYRYVGVEAATEIYEKGICLEEYLENLND